MKKDKKILSVLISSLILFSGTLPSSFAEVEALETCVRTSVSVNNLPSDPAPIYQQTAITTAVSTKSEKTETIVTQTSVKETSVSDSASVTIPVVSSSANVTGRTYYENITCPVSVGNATASAGQKSVSVPFNIDKFPNTDFLFNKYFTMQIYLQIPDGIELAGITSNDGIKYTVSETNGMYEVSINKANGYIILNIDDSAEPGDYKLELKGNANQIQAGINFVHKNYSCHFTGGSIVVEGENNKITSVSDVPESKTTVVTSADTYKLSVETVAVKGDANGDGKITAYDAAMIAKYLAEQKADTLPVYADFTGDGKITAYDAAMISKYLAEQSMKK